MKILIYSFGKFHNLKTNPAQEVGKEIINKHNSKNIDLIQLPVTYSCWNILKDKIDKFNPDFVLGLGAAIGLSKVKVETIGLNYKHAEIPDNNGIKLESEKINKSKNLSYETKINVPNFVSLLKEKGIPSEVSFHAGTYICNYTYYNCLQYLNTSNVKTLFIHIPTPSKETTQSNIKIKTLPTSLIAEGIFQTLNKILI